MFRRFVGAALIMVTLGYGLSLMLAFWAVQRLNEPSAVVALCLYAPPTLWLLPLGVLVPFSLLFRVKIVRWHLLCAAFVLGPLMGFRLNSPADEVADLTCVTNNIGAHHGFSLKPFVERENADVIALQDSFDDRWLLMKEFAGYHHAMVDQFTLFSRYPITKAEIVQLAPGINVAARFELLCRRQRIAIYNVRLPTPRGDLLLLRSWFGMLRRNPRRFQDTAGWERYAQTLQSRLALTHDLVTTLKREPLPFAVLGDFNTPSRGYGYRMVANALTDCFAKTGSGYGFTFPGDSPYWISFFQPWLRVDYIFAGRNCKPLYCRVEPGRRSEHRAVVAGFRFIRE
jgi:vancomycin resistance protein VanJ